MNTLRKGSIGEGVRFWQARIGAKVDGHFGPLTESMTKMWQLRHGLVGDGIVGPATQQKAGFVKTKFKNLYVLKIPFTAIKDMDILLSDKSGRKHVEDYDQEYDIICNAGMFDMKTGANVTDLVVDGKFNNGGNYTDLGLYFDGNKVGQAHTKDIIGKIGVDFLGGGPSLISHGVKAVDLKGIGTSFYTALTQRIAFGIDSEAFYIITTGQSKIASLETVVQEGLYQKVTVLIGADGGGSTAIDWHGIVFTRNRPVPSVLGIKLDPSW